MSSGDEQALRHAIARNLTAVLSLPSAGMLRHHKTRFLAEADGGFWIESVPPDEHPLVDRLIVDQVPVGVSFKGPSLRMVCTMPILQRRPGFVVNPELTVEALCLALPGAIRTVQRRYDYRVRLREASGLNVRMWRIAEAADLSEPPAHAAELNVELRDLSMGGLGVICPAVDGKPVLLLPEERLRVEMRLRDDTLVVEGRARFLKAIPSGGLQVGVAFHKLQGDLNGRQVLARLAALLGELQRDEARRMKLGMAE